MTAPLIIERVAEGGFLVREAPMPGAYSDVLHASTTIDEALAFIRKKLEPRPQIGIWPNPLSTAAMALNDAIRDRPITVSKEPE